MSIEQTLDFLLCAIDKNTMAINALIAAINSQESDISSNVETDRQIAKRIGDKWRAHFKQLEEEKAAINSKNINTAANIEISPEDKETALHLGLKIIEEIPLVAPNPKLAVITNPEKIYQSIMDELPSNHREAIYETIKKKVYELAPNHREAIKNINAKYKLQKFANLLNDPDKPEKGFIEGGIEIADKYYADLLELEK